MELLTSLYPFARWEQASDMAAAVRRMDELGLYALAIPEHVVVPDGPIGDSIGGTWPEAIVLGSYFAGMTERLRFTYYAMVLPYRNPVLLAKQISTFDYLSGGRTEFVFGAGWFEDEFNALGVPFDRRGERTDDALAAMRALWTSDGPVTHQGPFVQFEDVIFDPKPAQKPSPPIWIGGSGRRPHQRVVEHGDGWAPMIGDAASIAPEVARIRADVASAGRNPDELAFMFNMQIGSGDAAVREAFSHVETEDLQEEQATSEGSRADELISSLSEYADAGITHMMVVFDWESPSDYMTKLEWLAKEIVPHV